MFFSTPVGIVLINAVASFAMAWPRQREGLGLMEKAARVVLYLPTAGLLTPRVLQASWNSPLESWSAARLPLSLHLANHSMSTLVSMAAENLARARMTVYTRSQELWPWGRRVSLYGLCVGCADIPF